MKELSKTWNFCNDLSAEVQLGKFWKNANNKQCLKYYFKNVIFSSYRRTKNLKRMNCYQFKVSTYIKEFFSIPNRLTHLSKSKWFNVHISRGNDFPGTKPFS